ncbi:MAG TPA: hypothetical protein VKS60_24455 [Stellaceae bacterium]|nr:hypothetical protein [Stellaceae bacterium]
MSNVSRIDTRAAVEAEMNCLAPMAERPRSYTYEPLRESIELRRLVFHR